MPQRDREALVDREIAQALPYGVAQFVLSEQRIGTARCIGRGRQGVSVLGAFLRFPNRGTAA